MKRIPNFRKTKVFLGVGVTLLLMLTFVGHAKAVALKRGDILIADGDANAIIRVDPATGVQTVISSGGSLLGPIGLALDAAGNILVVNVVARAVIRVDPATGAQTVVSSGGFFVVPYDITIDGAGQILVVDTDAFGGSGGIIRLDPVTGVQTAVSSGGNFLGPDGITLDTTGQIIVADADAFGGGGGIIRVDPVSGAQTVIYDSSGGGPIQGPEGIALDATGRLLVAFRGHPDFNAPDGVARIDPVTGAVTVISSGGSFVGPVGITIVGFMLPRIELPPVVGSISSDPIAVGNSVVVALGNSVTFSAPWTDSNVPNPITALCTIVDVFGTIPTTNVAGTAPGVGGGTATCVVTFTNTGIFTVTLTVTDEDSLSGTSTAIQVVVYDSSAGFVTGGGWFTPDPQTCVCTPGSKATFGLVTRYQKGSSIPTGNQEFQYRVDNITLHSTSFDWLVVSGPQAQFQGTGTINGGGAFKFRVTVRDGDLIGQPDRFEIRILPAGSTDFGGVHVWKGGNGLTGSSGAGSIVIHQ